MYKVIPLDLSVQVDEALPRELVEPGKRINELFILDVPGGASFRLRLGQSSDFMTISRPFSMEPRGDSDANDGLYIANPNVQLSTNVELVVVYGEKSALQPVL